MDSIVSVHICGAGGIGTSGIALLFHEAGCRVTATDIRESELTAQLRAAGIAFDLRPREDWVRDAQYVITPSIFPEDHAEVLAARHNHIPVLNRTEALLIFCKTFDIPPLICVGTLARAKTASLLAAASENAGFCIGLAIPGKKHARLASPLIMDLDERELFHASSYLKDLREPHLVLSDWATPSYAYYPTDLSQDAFEARCVPLVAHYTRVVEDEDRRLFVVSSSQGQAKVCQKPLLIHCSASETKITLAQDHVSLSPCTRPDAQAFAVAAAVLGRSPDNVPDTHPVGWFETLDKRRTFDIRMHPVSVQNAIRAMKERFPQEALTVVIKPFQTTLDAYDANMWRKAFDGAAKVIVMTPGYNVSDKGCRNLATALKMRGLCATAHPQKQILAEYEPDGSHQLWIGSPDMFRP